MKVKVKDRPPLRLGELAIELGMVSVDCEILGDGGIVLTENFPGVAGAVVNEDEWQAHQKFRKEAYAFFPENTALQFIIHHIGGDSVEGEAVVPDLFIANLRKKVLERYPDGS